MKNPADNRAAYFYTPQEVADARDIIQYQGLDKYGRSLYPDTWVTWANKVLTWYGRFVQVLRRYVAAMQYAPLAVRALWLDIKNGLSLRRILRLLSTDEATNAPKKWQQPRHDREDAKHNGLPITPIRPKTQKHTRKMQVKRTTHNLQTAPTI